MAGSYSAGTGLVDVLPSLKNFHSRTRADLKALNLDLMVPVKPDMKGFDQKVKSSLGKPPTIEIKTKLNKAALARAEAEFVASEKRLQRARDTTADASARADIAEKSLSETRSNASSKASTIAAAELRLAQAKRASAAASNDAKNSELALASARTVARDARIKIETDIDTDRANGKLKAFAAYAGARYRIKLGVEADTSKAMVALTALGIYGKKAASITGNVSMDTGAATAKLTALGAAGAGVGFGVSGGLGIAGAALIAIPGLAAAALGPVAALAVGLNGVGDAMSAFSDASKSAGSNAAAAAQQQVQSARAIASASTQVAQSKTALQRAYQDAGWAAAAADRQLLTAEGQLVTAQRTRLKAQQDLTQATQDAADAMKDLNFQVRGGALSEREAVLALADAQATLDATIASGAGGDALERATLEYERQKLALEEVQTQNERLTAQQTKANLAGVDGSSQVVAAQNSVAQATEGVASAQQAVADAQEASAQSQIQSQRSLVDAQAAVLASQTQLTQAIEDSNAKSADSVDKINDAMARLSPNAREFVTAVQGLRPEFDAMKNSVQDALFQGLAPAFSSFASTILPEMATNLGAVSGAMNGLAKDAFSFLSSAPVMAQMKELFAGISQVLVAAGPAIQAIIQLFLQLATAAMPGLILIIKAVGTLATAIMGALQPLIDNGTLTAALGQLADLIVALAPIIGEVLSIAVQLMVALGPSLIAVVNALLPVFQMLGDLLISIAPVVGQIVLAIAQALVPILGSLIPVIQALLPVILQLITQGLAILLPIIDALSQVLLALAPMFGQVITQVAPFIAQLITQLVPIIVQVGTILATVLMAALKALLPVLPTLMAAVTKLFDAFAPMIPIIAQLVGQLLVSLMPILPVLANLFLTLIDAVLPLVPPLLNLVATLLPVLVDLINTLMPIILFLANVLGGVLAVILETVVVPAINLVVGIIKILIDIFKFLWDVIIAPILQAWGDAITWLWKNIIKPAFDAIGSACDAVGDFFKKMGDTIGGIWDGLKKIVHDGIQAVIDFVWNDGLRPVVNAVLKWIPGLDELPEFKLPAFATGGIVPGYAPGKDTVPAMVSPGEGILVPEAVRMLGASTILAWNKQAMASSGRTPSGSTGNAFADGGIATSVTTPNSVAPLTIDVSSLANLGDVATAVTAAVTALSVEITALAGVITVQWLAVSQATVSTADSVTSRTTELQQFVAYSWQTMQDSVWGSVNGQGQAFTTLQNGMAAVRSSMTATADWAVQQYARIQGAAADPIRWVLQQPMNAGLIAAWNSIDDQFALGKHVNPVPIGFAAGGYVSGPGTGTSDSIRALLSNGEFVLPANITSRILPFLEALRSGQGEALEAAGYGNRYATGGLVANTGSQLNASVARGSQWLREQAGKPYIWGGVGPVGYDCSGLLSALTNVLLGESNPYHRLGVAASQPWPGFVPGLSSAFATGYNSHHTAGTLAGLNAEAKDFNIPVLVGGNAAGADSGQFTGHASLPIVGGNFIPGGGPGLDPIATMTAAFADTLKMVDTIADMWPGNIAGNHGGGVAKAGVTAVSKIGVDKLNALTALASGSAGSPEVIAAVKAVATTFGWGDGPQWNALYSLIQGESGFNPSARNPTSSAAGLFQKMTSIHGPLEPTVAGQTRWGLNYIKNNPAYGSPVAAYSKWLSRNPHWYDDGGIATGLGFMQKNTIEPERILSPAQTRSFDTFVSRIGTSSPSTAGIEGDGRGGHVTGSFNIDGVLIPLIDGRIDYADHATGDALSRGSRT